MQSVDLSAYHTAIFFMEKGRVARQMRLSEFESLLDGYLGLSDLADQDVQGVLVLMDKGLAIRSLVFFRLYFDDEGRADSSWNLPVEALAMEGGRGPDLGDGPIRLVCRSQTPRKNLKSLLWDPSMSPQQNDFQTIRKAAAANTLRFPREKPPAPEPAAPPPSRKAAPAAVEADGDGDQESVPTLSEPAPSEAVASLSDEQHRQKMASLLRAQRLRLRTVKSQYREQLKLLRHEHRLEMQGLRLEIQEKAQQAERHQMMAEQLRRKLMRSKEEYLALQEQLTETMNDSANKDSLQAENVLLQEQLQRREKALEQAETALEEITRERDELAQMEPAEDSLLAKVRDGDLFVVAYNPGAGHMTLPYAEIVRYFQSPERYVAERLGVSESRYRQWLAHYESPRCQHGADQGKPCGKPLMRVSAPSEFRSGRDDRCDRHQVTLLAENE
ncbi:MAG: hypothetical protein R3296_05980 [Oleiphilaceae bacterium]|nr:hypothetical protein [Oleiphilaceae bacterium]